MVDEVQDQTGMKRRDFLAGASALSLSALGLSKVALARTGTPEAAPPGAAIATLGIYPAIGISRVGNSDEWFLAPEIPGLPPQPEGGFKDGEQGIKKQVQRFRIYGFDAEGRVVREITADMADVTWTVHVANTKAAWYGFNNPLDLKELAPGLPGQKRNAFIAEADREKMLAIDSGPVSITGQNTNAEGGQANAQMVGKFWDRMPVSLGELRTDAEGRLLVFPGNGTSESAIPDGCDRSLPRYLCC